MSSGKKKTVIREAIGKLVDGKDLSEGEAVAVMEEIMTGEATPAQLAAFVTALRMKGETVDEIAGMARVMREKALRVEVDGPLLDTCGTGGDNSGAFNVSTAAAFVCAGAGLRVAKHGNRAMTSRCGSADVLEALGARIDLSPDEVRLCIEASGIGFMFAPAFHPAMKFAAAPRREIGVRTVFNILGPLTNPAGATSQVLGVADARLAAMMAQVLGRLGCRHALVVHAEDGFDEVSVSAPTLVHELVDGNLQSYRVTPEELGFVVTQADEVRGGSPEENAAALRGVLSGAPGPLRDFTLVNAAAGLVAGDRTKTLAEGVAVAAQSIDGGSAMSALERFIAAANSA